MSGWTHTAERATMNAAGHHLSSNNRRGADKISCWDKLPGGLAVSNWMEKSGVKGYADW